MKPIESLTRRGFFAVTLSLLAAHVEAFDPKDGPPQWTLKNTAKFVTRTIIPAVTYDKITVGEAFEFMDAGRPKGYAPLLKADDTLLASKTTFSMAELDISVMDALAGIATHVNADLVISPGKVMLRARAASQKQTEWSIAGTTELITKAHLPQVNFEKTPLTEVLGLLARNLSHERVLILAADEKLLNAESTVSLDAEEISGLTVLTTVADEIQADLVISPGKIMLHARQTPPPFQKP